MADIDVVKKGSSAWVWILLVIILAVVLWVVLGRGGTPGTSGSIESRQPHFAAASHGGGCAQTSLVFEIGSSRTRLPVAA